MTSAAIYGCLGHRLTEAEKAFFAEVRPWGFILFRRNIDTPEQVRALTDELDLGRVPGSALAREVAGVTGGVDWDTLRAFAYGTPGAAEIARLAPVADRTSVPANQSLPLDGVPTRHSPADSSPRTSNPNPTRRAGRLGRFPSRRRCRSASSG